MIRSLWKNLKEHQNRNNGVWNKLLLLLLLGIIIITMFVMLKFYMFGGEINKNKSDDRWNTCNTSLLFDAKPWNDMRLELGGFRVG